MRLLEVCAGSVESIRAAYEGGAQRVELCSALSEDGLTPSLGMIRYALELGGGDFSGDVENFEKVTPSKMAVHVLIRPRGGDFVYSETEVRCMEDDIRLCRELGVQGVVIGALTPDGDIDLSVCRRLVAAAGPLHVTFHRAFDVCRRPQQALEEIIALGCDRLLTSGQAPTAAEGIAPLRQLVEQAVGRLTILAGCGVNPQNARRILSETGATEIHASARSTRQFGRMETDPEIVRQILLAINP